MMTVNDKYRRAMLVKEALKELSKYCPEVTIWTDQELRNIQQLAGETQKLITNGVKDHPATFLLICELAGLDPAQIRRNLRMA